MKPFLPALPARGLAGFFLGGDVAPIVDVFIDYQNVHMSGHRAFCGKDDEVYRCQVDPVVIATELVKLRAPGGVIQTIRVYRGRPDPRKEARLAGFWDKRAARWRLDDRVVISSRPLRYPQDFGLAGCVEKPVEKGIDVALAVDLVDRAISHDFEVAIVFTHDTDILPAIELASRRGAHIETAGWQGANVLRNAAIRWRHTVPEVVFVGAREAVL